MLKLKVPACEYFDSSNEEFVDFKGCELVMEHSLVSISKWESKYHKPFLTQKELSKEEQQYYFKCMTISQNIDPLTYRILSNDHIKLINAYVSSPMSATVINDQRKKEKNKKEILTSELIYYYMTALNIPFECQKWHLNRLLTLINISSIKQSQDNKMPKQEALRRQASINAARRKAHNTKG